MIDIFPTEYIITGALGWCGKRLVRLLATGFEAGRLAEMPKPSRIRCIVLPDQNAHELKAMGSMIEIVEGDVCIPEDCQRFVDGMRGATLIHTAGVIHPKRTREFFLVNRDGTLRLVKAAALAGLARAVVVSSNSPLGTNPHSDHRFDEQSPYNPCLGYGNSKMEMEIGLRDLQTTLGFPVTIIRSPWFYGPDQPPRQTLFFTMIKDGRGPIIGNGENRRSMAYIDNLAQGLVLAGSVDVAAGRTYWISDVRPYTMHEIIDTIEVLLEREFGFTVAHRRMRLSGFIAEVAGLVDGGIQAIGLYHQKIHVLSEMNKTIACDISLARQELDYEPTYHLINGMRESIRWCLANGQRI